MLFSISQTHTTQFLRCFNAVQLLSVKWFRRLEVLSDCRPIVTWPLLISVRRTTTSHCRATWRDASDKHNNNTNNNGAQDDIYSAIIYSEKSYATFHCGSSPWTKVGQRQVALQLVCKAANVTFESAAISRTLTHGHFNLYYYSTMKLILIYRPSEGGWLSRPRHCADCRKCAARAQSCILQ